MNVPDAEVLVVVDKSMGSVQKYMHLTGQNRI